MRGRGALLVGLGHSLAPSHVRMFAEHYADELEPLLETIILEDFNVQTEDGSPCEVCARSRCLYTRSRRQRQRCEMLSARQDGENACCIAGSKGTGAVVQAVPGGRLLNDPAALSGLFRRKKEQWICGMLIYAPVTSKHAESLCFWFQTRLQCVSGHWSCKHTCHGY